MKKILNLVAAVFLTGSAFAQGAEQIGDPGAWSLFSRFESFSYSEPAPIDQVIHDLEGDSLESGDVVFTHNIIEVGGSYKAFELSVFQRYDYYFDFTSDTAALLYQDKNDLPVTSNREYDIDLEVNHLRAKGIKLAYQFSPTQNLNLKIAASYLQADALVDGDITGTISTTDNDFNGQLQLDYAYTEDNLFDRVVDKPDGQGYALDLYVHWQASDKFTLDISLEDLVSRITWDNAPNTQAKITSNTISFDANGFLNATPVLSGKEGFSDHRQRLPLRVSATGTYRIYTDVLLLASWKRIAETDFPIFGLRYAKSPGSHWDLSYDIKAQALGIAYQSGSLGFSLTSDNAKWDEAHTLGFSMRYRINF